MKPIKRRQFVKDALKATAATVGSGMLLDSNTVKAAASGLSFTQAALPYSFAALEPSIDALTMEVHYSRHHAAYVKNANDAITNEAISFTSELEFFSNTSTLSAKARNNGGGSWNHNFFWQVMKPGGSIPAGKVMEALTQAFGSWDKFKEQFSAAAMGRFGSGWAWLVNDHGVIKIGSTPNQDNPLMDNADLRGTPLLALDVWEHAYYLKYQNKRADYITNWWSIVNWDEVARRLG